ncbi:MAG: substrate-binding domain-containing protein [Hyphomicrobiaceae bacterium]|nr:substrate-binding domain-containing protein [Hyphomicrobiaceae bacterium]MCC0022971.1 substrate-binding domain-containing protein [Hyphomicrobiaceae bacterium]
MNETSRFRLAESRRRVTIRDLARDLDLSITTISRALNGHDDVGEATRTRVKDRAEELGYRPNRNAQRLVTQRTNCLGWIQSAVDEKVLDPHFVEVMGGVLHTAREKHYDIMMTGEASESQILAYDRYVRDNSVDGFIVDLPRPGDPRIDFLLEHGAAFCVHGRTERHEEFSWVDIDNAGIFYRLIHLLAANGHRNIAFINGDERFTFAAQRRIGVRHALRDLGLPPESVTIHGSRHPMGLSGQNLTRAALADNNVTAIVYSSVLMAIEGQATLSELGREAGRNICVATMDDQLHYLDASQYEGRFTFARSSLREAGKLIASTLMSLCERPDEPIQTLVPYQFSLGDDLDMSKADAAVMAPSDNVPSYEPANNRSRLN